MVMIMVGTKATKSQAAMVHTKILIVKKTLMTSVFFIWKEKFMDNVQPRQHYKLYKSGKFWITAMVSSLFVATMGAINSGAAHADDLPQDGKVSFASPHPIQGYIQFSNGKNDPVLNIRVNDQVVFCINPFAHLKGGEYASSAQGQQDLTATYWQSLTKQQQSLINNAAYLAQAQGAAHDSETYFAGQLVVWSIISGQNGIPGVMAGSDKIDSADMHNAIGATIIGWDSSVVGAGAITKAEQILNNAAAMGQRPNFSPAPLNVLAGQSATVTDTNGVLQNFKNIRGTGGLSAAANGNDLTVSADNSSSSGSVRMRTTSRDDSQQPYYVYGTYVGNDLSNPQQPVFAAKDPSYNEAELQVNVKKANLKIDKSILKNGGVSTKDLTNGNYSLANNVFEVHKDTADGEVVATVTTDANGNAETGSILAAGKYVVTEKQASNGLARTFNPVTVNVDSVDNLEVKAFGTNAEVTGAISIQKKGAETGTQMWNDNYSLAGNVFKIHKGDINGEVVAEVTTDENGYAHTREDLPLGTYVVEEVQASKGFVKSFAPRTVEIKYAGQDKQVVLSMTEGTNQEVKGKIVVDKSGKESDKKLWNGNYSLANNEFDIHENNELGKVVAHIKTDENGHAETDANLPLGKYVVVESKASKGFTKTFKPQTVELKYLGQTVALVADLARDTNQEVTGSTSVIKQDKQTGDKTQGRATFAGAEYTLYHADGTPVKWNEDGQPVPEVTVGKKVSRDNVTLRIDEDLNQAGVKHLALGDYYWQETKAPEGYQKDKEQYKFSISYQDEYTPVVTNEETSKEQVINFSFDGFKYTQSPSGKSQSGYDGIQLSLIPINGTKGEKQTVTTHTDANGYDGYYKFDNISYGDYELWEENAPEGYQHIDPLYVHIELNADKTAYVFTVTEKGQSTPLKKMTVPVSKIDEGTGNVYLSKLFLFDKSEDTKKCNGGGNNQPVINITNNNNQQQQQQQQQQQDNAAKAVETKNEVKPADTGEQKQETTSQKQTQAQETTAPAKPVAQETKVETPQQTAPVEQPKQEQTVSTAKATTPATTVKRSTSTASMPSTGKKASNDKVTYLALAAAATGAIFITGNFDKVKKMKRKKARLAVAKKAA